jgi:hypothetical protein
VIPAEAVEAAAKQMAVNDGDLIGWALYQADAQRVLEAAAPYMLAGVEDVLAQWDAEASGNQNVANELRKGPRTNMNRSEIARHEQAAVIAKNHATRIRNAIAGTK